MTFLMFNCVMENIKENRIWLKLIISLYNFKLFNLYINKLNEFKIIYIYI